MAPFSYEPPLQADEQLARRAADRLAAQLPSPEYRIVVEVQNGVVILEGVVVSEQLRELVSHIAWETTGTQDVCNTLGVGPVARP